LAIGAASNSEGLAVDNRVCLPKNLILDASYCIDRVIGSGGFGVTYVAEDLHLKTTVAIKEYYPADFGDRDAEMSVRPRSEQLRGTFEWGRDRFLSEAQTLARFRHPSIVRITRVFEAHGTAYMIMDYEDGQSFEAWLARLGRPPSQAELDRIAALLLDALELLHAQSLLHRDIAPDNIVVRPDGSPVLLDFGAARQSVAQMSRSITRITKAGFSPHEQYALDSRLQGPWSDLYAFAATLYRAVTGMPPQEATLRAGEDRMPPATVASKGRYRSQFLAAIDTCLKVRCKDRPQSVAELRPLLLEQPAATPVHVAPALAGGGRRSAGLVLGDIPAATNRAGRRRRELPIRRSLPERHDRPGSAAKRRAGSRWGAGRRSPAEDEGAQSRGGQLRGGAGRGRRDGDEEDCHCGAGGKGATPQAFGCQL
jgi:serine/threonine protein kinase